MRVIYKGNEWMAIKNLVDDILDSSYLFKKVDFSFISRKLNWVAHCLTKLSFEREESFEWSRSFPNWLKGFFFFFLLMWEKSFEVFCKSLLLIFFVLFSVCATVCCICFFFSLTNICPLTNFFGSPIYSFCAIHEYKFIISGIWVFSVSRL